jgi:hypothetical protein
MALIHCFIDSGASGSAAIAAIDPVAEDVVGGLKLVECGPHRHHVKVDLLLVELRQPEPVTDRRDAVLECRE